MDYANRRREEQTLHRRERRGFWDNVSSSHYLTLTVALLMMIAGFGVGIPFSFAALSMIARGFEPGLVEFLIVVTPSVPALALAWCGIRLWQAGSRRTPDRKPRKLDGEKQLLVAILDAGGSITPVEAALESSLTVDEAEEILSRLADRGHLLVQSHDGTLYYTLPVRRSDAIGERSAPQS